MTAIATYTKAKPKIAFFGISSAAKNATAKPVIEALISNNYDVHYYDSVEPNLRYDCRFFKYPELDKDLQAFPLDDTTTLFEYAELLLDKAEKIIDVLLEDVFRQKPDCIIYSHISMWGKMIGQRFQIPNVALSSTFVLHKQALLQFPYQRHNVGSVGENIDVAIRFNRRLKRLYARLNMDAKVDIWDSFVNKGDLNLVYILEEFQPMRDLFGAEYKFLGYTRRPNADCSNPAREIIYCSMGTIFNTNNSIFRHCIQAIGERPATIALGNSLADNKFLGEVPKNIEVLGYCNQVAKLGGSILFISHGGMASINDALACSVPLIVIPTTQEQRTNAYNVQSLRIGICILPEDLTSEKLKHAIDLVIMHRADFVRNIRSLLNGYPLFNAEQESVAAIDSLVRNRPSTKYNEER